MLPPSQLFYIVDTNHVWMTEVLDVLCSRLNYLEAIESGCSSKAEVADALDVSESAVYKAVRELRDHDIVEEDAYGLSVTGRLLLDSHRRMQRIAEASELLDEVDVPPEVLEDARPAMPERHAPQRPIDKLDRAVEDSGTLRGLAPTIIERYVTTVAEFVQETGLDVEFVVESSVFEELSGNYPEEFWSSVEEGMEVLATEEELPFGLALLDDRVVLVVYDDRGRVQGALFMRSAEALDWAEEVYESCRLEAEHVEGVEV